MHLVHLNCLAYFFLIEKSSEVCPQRIRHVSSLMYGRRVDGIKANIKNYQTQLGTNFPGSPKGVLEGKTKGVKTKLILNILCETFTLT